MKLRFSAQFIQSLFLVSLLVLVGCFQQPSSTGRRVASGLGSTGDNSHDGTPDGPGSGPTDGSIGDSTDLDLTAGRSEIRFIVDPFTGTYKNKVTIPKNFTGELYLSGLNITSLNDRIVSVRFNFGREMEPIEIPATIVRGSGITPQTDIEVLALSMDDRPFQDLRLLYDLFDYNDYRDENGNETLPPTNDPRDGNLYCRGLRLEHDPTFQGSATNIRCDGLNGEGQPTNERCLYSYAKVLDTGLFDDNDPYDNNPGLAFIPTEPQIDLTSNNGLGYNADLLSNNLKKCLPDNNNRINIEQVLGVNFPSPGSALLNQTLPMPGDFDVFKGPFRSVNFSSWQISGGALFSQVNSATSATGLFQESFDGTVHTGYKSFLFPRAGKMELGAGVEHFSSNDPFDIRTLDSLLSAGQTRYMDGCNMRVSNYDRFTNEGISSCNVTGTIEIITRNQETGQVEVLASSKDVKLQLVRPSLTNYRGEEVLYQSLKTCSSSSACGTSECCFNNRCWSKEIVSQCLEDVPVVGNRGTGQACGSDYECSSFCCNQSTGTCAVHVNTDTEQVLCSKAPGQQCVSKEYCRKENISECYVVKTGTNTQGGLTCALRCYNVPTFGDCRNGICIPPLPKPIPQFDPRNPNCEDAIDPPNI